MTRHPDFPVELWDDILGRIHSQNDLLGLAGSSRRFHAIAERELYCSPNLFEHQLDFDFASLYARLSLVRLSVHL